MPGPGSLDNAAAAALIARHPLAWVVSRGFNANALPLLAECDAEGRIAALFGHVPLRFPIVEDLRADPAALILFNGPAGYVSPRYVSNRDWAPTWNFAVLRFEVEIELVPAETAASIERLLDHMEGPLPQRWSSEELGARRAALLSRVVAFRAQVRSFRPQFKLGQDEARDTFAEIVDHLPERELAAWMAAFAEDRAP